MLPRLVVVCFPIALCLASTALAEEQSLGEVQVHAESETEEGRSTEPSHDSIAFTSVVTSKDLKGRRTSLTEVLEETGGVHTRNLGGLDDFATVSIRGSTTEQVAVYLDGLLLNPALGGSVNIATIPTDQIERIEVYKGAAPASFGTSAIGGVINIITKKGKTARETALYQSLGSFTTYESSLFHSQRLRPFAYQVGYTYSRSEGDFDYTDNNGTPFNPSDDRIRRRTNNEFARHSLITGLQGVFPRGEITVDFKNQFFREDRGIPGLGTLTSEIADLSTTRNGTSVELTRREIISHLDLHLTPHFEFQKQQFSDPAGEIGLGVEDNDDLTLRYGARLLARLLVGTHQRWTANLDYTGEQFLPKDFENPPSGPKSVRNSVSLSLENEIFLLDDRLVINPSIRTEHLFNDQAGTASKVLHPVSGKIGIKYCPLATCETAALRTNFSRSYRLPSFSELFGDRGSLTGNPTLNPEQALNWDIGGAFFLKPVRMEVSYFLNHADNLIQLLQTSQSTAQARNLSSGRIQGVEAFVGLSLLNHLDLSGNYTFQWAKDTSGLPGLNGKFLPGRPRHEASARAALFNRWGRIFADLTFIDDNYLDTQNVLRADSRLLMGAGFSVNFLKRFTTTLEAKNLMNDRVSDIIGFPLPGRSYYGKLEVKI